MREIFEEGYTATTRLERAVTEESERAMPTVDWFYCEYLVNSN
ncbi:MAG: hypothetical protein AAF092_01760 [Pseudomonadota bacterium]